MGDIQQLAQEGMEIPESGRGFAGPMMNQELDLCQLALEEGDSNGNCVELETTP